MKSKLKIAFLTSLDPNDRRSWSGIFFYMLKSLEQQFTTVVPLGPAKLNPATFFFKILCYVSNRAFPRYRYNILHNKILGRFYARFFEDKLRDNGFDLIFSPTSSTEIAFLKTHLPICYFSDTSFRQIKDYYPEFSNLLKYSVEETELIQANALKKSAVVIHASQWATDFAVKHYHVDPSRSYTVAMGANIDAAPDLVTIESRVKNRTSCNLLMLGVDWSRKGGSIAYDAFIELNASGIATNLTVCGCVPPSEFEHPNLRVIPFLDKNDEADYKQFLQLLSSSHFLILPSRAECSGIVFAEASAFGIPSITTETGGVASMVEEGVNGYRLPFDAGGSAYAFLIKSIFDDPKRYRDLVYSSRRKFDDELNWQKWGEKIRAIIDGQF
jgi:glycosyltransferase involved in cell wall biosynthesis